MRPLGKRQRAVLASLRRYGEWRPGGLGGWVYGSDSETEAVLKSLERRGLARCVAQGGYFGSFLPILEVDPRLDGPVPNDPKQVPAYMDRVGKRLAKRAEEEGR